MKNYTAANIRNIGIFGHGGEGKTTLTEAMLYNAGLIERIGKVENGNTTTDYDPEEVKRTIPLTPRWLPSSGRMSRSTSSMPLAFSIFTAK